jgi:hypothetical protein
MDADVYYNGISVSNLQDGGVFFGFAVSENVTFTSITRINYIKRGGGVLLYQGVLYRAVIEGGLF